MIRGRLELFARVFARDRGEAPAHGRDGQPRRPGPKPGRRLALLRLEGFEIEREGLGCGGQRPEPVPPAKRREVRPVVGVGSFSRRGQVGSREIVLDRTGELGEDPRVFPRDRAERRSRRQERYPVVLAALSVDLRFHAIFFARKARILTCLRSDFSQARWLLHRFTREPSSSAIS